MADFVACVSGPDLINLLSLCRRVPSLAKSSLGVTTDLVRRSSAAVVHLLNAGAVLLVIEQLFDAAAVEGGGSFGRDPSPDAPEATIDGEGAVGAPTPPRRDSGTPSTPYSTTLSTPASYSASPYAAASAPRVAAVRVLSAMVGDSLHGARIADTVCRLLTPRFRPHFESKPEAFLAFFDSEHASGSKEQANEREWTQRTRELLRRHVVVEATRLLHEAATGGVRGEAVEGRPQGAADASSGVINGILERLEALWGSAFSSRRDGEPGGAAEDAEEGAEGAEGAEGDREGEAPGSVPEGVVASKLVDELFSRPPLPAGASGEEAGEADGAAVEGKSGAGEPDNSRPPVISHF